MKLDTTFTVLARCSVFEMDNPDKETYKEDIELKFNMETAEMFLFRWNPSSFLLDGYKVAVKYNNLSNLQSIFLFKDNKGYIIKNLAQVINDVLTGYLQIRTLDKISDIMTFDFKAGIDIQESEDVEDEFES